MIDLFGKLVLGQKEFPKPRKILLCLLMSLHQAELFPGLSPGLLGNHPFFLIWKNQAVIKEEIESDQDGGQDGRIHELPVPLKESLKPQGLRLYFSLHGAISLSRSRWARCCDTARSGKTPPIRAQPPSEFQETHLGKRRSPPTG